MGKFHFTPSDYYKMSFSDLQASDFVSLVPGYEDFCQHDPIIHFILTTHPKNSALSIALFFPRLFVGGHKTLFV